MPLDPRSVTPVAFKRVLSENAQGHIGSSWATQVGRPTTLVPFAQNWSLGYESDLKQGCWIQWPQLYHPQMATVSKIMSSGPQLGSQGYPRKVTFRRMAQFISVRYESALNQGCRIQWWCLFHYQNNTVSEKKSAGPQLGSQGYPRKGTLRRMAQFISVRYESPLNQGCRIHGDVYFTIRTIQCPKKFRQDPH